MPYDSIDIKEIVRQAEDNVRGYDDDALRWRQVEDGSFDYGSLIPDELYKHESGTQAPVVVQRPGLEDDRKIIESIVGWPVRITVDLGKMGPEAGSREDQLEGFWAYSTFMCDPKADKKQRVHHHQALWPYSGIWQSIVPYDPPKKLRTETTKDYEYRLEGWKKSYWRYKWNVPTPNTISFLDIEGDVSLACMYEDIPVIDFMEMYAELEDEDDTSPLTLYSQQFPWLRASDGTSPERDNETVWFKGKHIRHWLVDNGHEIYHQVEAGGLTNSAGKRAGYGDFHPACDEQLNTFGRPSFVLIHSTYRSAGVKFSPLIASLARGYYNVTMMQSLYYTMQANDRWLTTLPTDVAMAIARQAEMDPTNVKLMDQYKTQIMAGSVNPMMGQPTNANGLPAQWSENIDRMEAQLERVRAPITLLNPSEITQRNAPATTVLAAQQQGLRPWEKPTTSATTGFETLLTMQAHDIVYGLNAHLANVGESKTHNRGFRDGEKSMPFIAGDYVKSSYQPAAKITKGHGYDLSPEAFKEFLDSGRVTVEPIADTDATRAAKQQMAMALYNNDPRLATIDDVLAAGGETDLTRRKAELNADRIYQEKVPMLDNLATMQFLEREAARTGRNIGEMAVFLGMPRQMGGNGDNFNAQTNAINTTRVSPPAGPMPSEGGMA